MLNVWFTLGTLGPYFCFSQSLCKGSAVIQILIMKRLLLTHIETGGEGTGHKLKKNDTAQGHDIKLLEPKRTKMVEKSTSATIYNIKHVHTYIYFKNHDDTVLFPSMLSYYRSHLPSFKSGWQDIVSASVCSVSFCLFLLVSPVKIPCHPLITMLNTPYSMTSK